MSRISLLAFRLLDPNKYFMNYNQSDKHIRPKICILFVFQKAVIIGFTLSGNP